MTERAHAVGHCTPSQALPRQLSQRESQGLRLVAEVLGEMRRFPAVLLPLPLGEVASRSDDGEGEPVLHHDMRLRGAVGAQQLC